MINDVDGRTLASASSLGMEKMPKIQQAEKVGALVAEKAKSASTELLSAHVSVYSVLTSRSTLR